MPISITEYNHAEKGTINFCVHEDFCIFYLRNLTENVFVVETPSLAQANRALQILAAS